MKYPTCWPVWYITIIYIYHYIINNFVSKMCIRIIWDYQEEVSKYKLSLNSISIQSGLYVNAPK